jgi:RNA polymerase sigma-70 factor (ECF subfamily)
MTDWDAIVREYGPVVWRTACRLLTREADAADCFQRTFLAAVELEATEPIRNWPAVLKRLATARALEQLRARYRDAARLGEFPENPPADLSAPDPAEAASGGELATALRAALSALDPVQAEVFCLVCLDGLDYSEAAVALGVTASHAGVLLHRARAALRERLAAFDPNRQHSPGGHP